jgi:hypothetical protein
MVELDSSADKATITLTGPTGVWFGAGFNAQAMKDGPWAVRSLTVSQSAVLRRVVLLSDSICLPLY